jgi:3',5'-cyclic AMP phosphodiesterase CpdA
MQHFAHVSDPHLTPLHDVPRRSLLGKRALGYLSWTRRRRHRHLPALLERVSDDLRAWAPDHIAVTGDLTQIGLAAEHTLARHWLHRLGPPASVSLSPGNHDFYARDSARTLYTAWAGYLPGPDAWPHRRDCGELSFISLCSGTPSGAAFATGTLGPAQLERLRQVLRDTAGRFRAVLVHHSPHPRSHAWRKRLTDARALRAVLAAEGAELVLHGHAHSASLVWLEFGDRRIPVLGAPSASLRSSDPSHRAGYQRVQVARTDDGWRADVETRQCVGDAIETTATHALSLPRR